MHVLPRNLWKKIIVAIVNFMQFHTVSAKFVYNDDLHVFDNPTDESEEFIKAVELFFNCIGRIVIEPPLYKLYPNKLYQDFDKSIKVN